MVSSEGSKSSSERGEGLRGWLCATNELLLTHQTSPVVSASLFTLALICTYLLSVFDIIDVLSLQNGLARRPNTILP